MRSMTITSSVSTDLVHLASSRGASYADARTVEREHEAVSVKDGAVESVTRTSDQGFGFRVVHKGAWGFAASDRTDEASLRALVDEAFRRAEASASVQRRGVKLAPIAPQRGEYRTSLERDPFSVPLAERIDHLRAVDAKSLGPNVKTRRSSVAAYRTRKRLVTSEGTDVSQEIVETGAGLSVLAVKAGRKPASRYDSRLVRQAGWGRSVGMTTACPACARSSSTRGSSSATSRRARRRGRSACPSRSARRARRAGSTSRSYGW